MLSGLATIRIRCLCDYCVAEVLDLHAPYREERHKNGHGGGESYGAEGPLRERTNSEPRMRCGLHFPGPKRLFVSTQSTPFLESLGRETLGLVTTSDHHCVLGALAGICKSL